MQKKNNPDFIIVARTDARAPLGIDEAIKRGKKYREIGADVVFVEAPHSIEELKAISSEIDAPLVANMIEDGITPNLTSKDLLGLGSSTNLLSLTNTCIWKKNMFDAFFNSIFLFFIFLFS